MTQNFTRPAERDAYRLLHTEGVEALDAQHGMVASQLINRWADKGMVRVSYPAGSLVVKTFKKYAV